MDTDKHEKNFTTENTEGTNGKDLPDYIVGDRVDQASV